MRETMALTSTSEEVQAIADVIGSIDDVETAETVFGQFKAIAGMLDTLDTLEEVIGASGDLSDSGTLFGTINDIESYVSLIGSISDTDDAGTLFGRIGQASDTGSSDTLFGKINSAKTYANDAYSLIQEVRDDIGAENGEFSIYEYIAKMNDIIDGLKNTTEEIMFTKDNAEDMTKQIVDSMVNAVNESAKSLGLKIETVKALQEEDLGDNELLKNKMREVKEMLDIIARSKDGDGVVVTSWFESD